MNLFRKLFGKDNNSKEVLSLVDYNIFFTKSEYKETPLSLLNLGEIDVPTGNIIVCDPLTSYYDAIPLTKNVKPGKYPVTISVADTKDSGQLYAAAKLEFTKTIPTKWVLALNKEQDINELKDQYDYFGFPVDAGLGCFLDVETQKYFKQFDDKFHKENPDFNIYDDLLADEFKKNAVNPNDINDCGNWVNYHLPNKPNLNIIMFQTGSGDGVYPAYWGIADNGEICSLVIDLHVF